MDIKKNFDTAFKDHQKGDLDNAVTLYKKRFSNSKDLIIKKWPSKSTLNAWYVKLIQQGYQTFTYSS